MKLTRLVPVAAAVAMLAACSPVPSTVSLVNGERVSAEDLQRSIDGCAELGYTTQELPVKQHVLFLTAGELVNQVAANHGIEFAEGELRALAQQTQLAGVLGNEECARLSYPGVSLGLLTEAVGDEEILSELRGADVEINPRYGEWDAETLSLVGSGSLSVPTAP